MAATIEAERPRWRRWLPHLLRLLVVGAIVVWIARFAEGEALGAALMALSPIHAAGAGLLLFATIGIGSWRWRIAMRAFGAADPPPLGTLCRVFLVGLFYNTYVPGAVGGDLVRGVISRGQFEHPAAGVFVVFAERIIGLATLALFGFVGLLVGPPLFDLAVVAPWLGLAAGGGVVAIGGLLLSGRLKGVFSRLPPVSRPRAMLAVIGISFAGHVVTITMIWLLAVGLRLPLSYLDMVLVVPVMLVAQALPVSLAGFGPREASLVALLARFGLDASRALALSFSYAALMLSVALLGGLVQLVSNRALALER